MLNQNDRRRLEEIERRLLEEDPEFARRFTRWPPSDGRTSRLWLPVLVLVVGALGMLLSLLLALPAVFVLSLGGAVGGWVWLRRRRR
jgi:4-hydroxybenzoate polyprenyltransferase